MKKLRAFSPAKINLYLSILGRRSDEYHELETIFQAVDLMDEIIIEKSHAQTTLEIPDFSELAPDNLIIRAVEALEFVIGKQLQVKIRLIKRIPIAGGLGGGSSNAAATLLGINRLFDLNLETTTLKQIAISLGADVPFFLLGGTAMGRGIGEELTSIDIEFGESVLLVNPGIKVSTAEVFQAYSKGLTAVKRQARLMDVLATGNRAADLLLNDLQPVAETLYSEVRECLAYLRRAGLKYVLMSGSGPTMFAIAPEPELIEVFKTTPSQWKCFLTTPWRRGIVFD